MAVKQTTEGVNFGDLGFYSGSFTLPKGRYALEFLVKMHAPTKQDGSPAGNPRLAVIVTAHPIDETGKSTGDAMEQPMSLGSKAHLSFAPHPETGKSLVPVPGAPAGTAPKNTNWNLFLKSLYDSGLPKGVFTNDISVLDGIWVVTDQVPEPEERKSYASTAATGEAAAEQSDRKGGGMIPVVVEILEDGKPWEGSGGIPTEEAEAPKTAVAKGPAKGATPAAAAKKVAPATPPPADDEDLMSQAVAAATDVMEQNDKGTTKLKLRTGTFRAATAKYGEPVAQKIIDTFFSSDEAVNSVLGQLGFKLEGSNVKPA